MACENSNDVVPWSPDINGGDSYCVVFNGDVWHNAWWVNPAPDPGNCPGNAKGDQDPNNPWRKIRAATAAEIAKGNPTSCNPSPDCGALLCKDQKTEDMYTKVGYKPDGSGTNLSYTSARVAKPVHNLYKADATKPQLSAYITDWAQYDGRLQGNTDPTQAGRGFDLTKIDPFAYDRLIFSFMGICGDFGEKKDTVQKSVDGWNSQAAKAGVSPMKPGHLVLMDPWGDLATFVNVGLTSGHMDLTYNNYLQYYQQHTAAGVLGGMREIKNKNPNLKYAFSVGGWTLSNFFSDMAKDKAMRQEFVDSVIDFMNRFPMFDGIDIDWEYPGAAGDTGNHFDPEHDGDNYAVLISELRAALDKKFGKGAKTITIAMSADVDKMKFSKVDKLKAAGLDAIFLMSYDFFGTGWAKTLAHHSNLNNSKISDFSAVKAINYLKSIGIPMNMVHLGVANYARAAAEANLQTLNYNINGKALGSFENGAYEFFDLIKNALECENNVAQGKNGFVLMTDTDADADILYNEDTQHYISLDTPRTAKNKGGYVAQHGLAGCFSWSGDQDDGLLANACREGMAYEVTTENFAMDSLYNTGQPFNMASYASRRRLLCGDKKKKSGQNKHCECNK